MPDHVNTLPVADKRVDLTYDAASQAATLTRYADLAATQQVAATDYLFDQAGRLTGMTHSKGASIFADYDWMFDEANRMTRFESLIDGVADYTNDDTGQLTGAEYTAGAGLPTAPPDEQYVYDENGNRLNNGYTVGPNNQLLSDGTHTYTYDAEGNRTSRTHIATGEVTEYHWDHRNRLTRVSTRATANGPPTTDIHYAYDFGQRWIRKTRDTNADGTIEESRVFIHDNGQIVLDFQKTGIGDASNGDLSHRYLWGQHVDQLLADETVDTAVAADDVAWALTDHLNTVRDLVAYDPATDTTTVIKHITYDAFGNVTSDSAPGIDSLFLFTARPYDPDTGLQNNLNRWYDARAGRWVSEDPLEFFGLDANLNRYVRNSPADGRDHLGLFRVDTGPRTSATRTQAISPAVSIGTPHSLGAAFDFSWEPVFNPQEFLFVQKVSLWGVFLVADECGFTHSVSFEEEFVEAWIDGRLRNRGISKAQDNHFASPYPPAHFLEDKLAMKFVPQRGGRELAMISRANRSKIGVEAWSLYVRAEFDLYNTADARLFQYIGPWRRFLGKGLHQFRITDYVIRNGSRGATESQVFSGYLYPGRSAEQLPPWAWPVTAFNRPRYTSTDVWHIQWETGMTGRVGSYSGQYRPS
jgi:RHS repeat-associated protein